MNSIVQRLACAGFVSVVFSTGCLGQLGGAAATPARPKPSEAELKGAAESILVANEALKYLDAQRKGGEVPKSALAWSTWRRRLFDAQIIANGINKELGDVFLKDLAARQAQAEQLFKQGEANALDVLEAKQQRLEAECLIARLMAQKTQPAPAEGAAAGGLGSGFGGDGGGATSFRRHAPVANPKDAARNKLIEEKLETTVTFNFPNETPFEDILKYIKETCRGKDNTKIPIFVNLKGLGDEDKTMTSTVAIDLEGVPLRVTLRLLLDQLGLDYRVREGMIYINSRQYLEEEEKNN